MSVASLPEIQVRETHSCTMSTTHVQLIVQHNLETKQSFLLGNTCVHCIMCVVNNFKRRVGRWRHVLKCYSRNTFSF